MKNLIAVAMSGGVDSSISAWIMKKLNYNLIGIFIINLQKNCYENDLKYVIWISNILNIKLKIINFSKIYKNKIFKKLIIDYKNNIIPNPDVNCNFKIKFKELINYIKNLKIKFLVTGHYIKLIRKNNKILIKIPKDIKKNQIYFLWKVKKKYFRYLIFPLGNIYKKEVRKISDIINFPNKYKKDSYGICFLENKNFKNLILKYLKNRFGYILNELNQILGIHMGYFLYSLGQKKGLNLNFKSLKMYVTYKYKKKNIIYIVYKRIHPWSLYLGVFIKNINIFNKKFKEGYYYCQIKHSSNFTICKIRYINKNKLFIVFNKLQISLNIGQSLVFYKKNIFIGGGEVCSKINFFNNF